MFRSQAIAGIARRATLIAFFAPAICLAAGGTIRFSGAITEPACAVSASHAGFSADMLKRLGASAGATSIDAGAMQLTMRCHANQSVGLSFDSRTSAVGAGSDAEAGAVQVVLSRVGKDVRAGETIPVALTGRSDNNIDIRTALRKAGGTLPESRMDSAILVSVSYQ